MAMRNENPHVASGFGPAVNPEVNVRLCWKIQLSGNALNGHLRQR